MKALNTLANDIVTIAAIAGLIALGLDGVATGEMLILAIAGLGGYRMRQGSSE